MSPHTPAPWWFSATEEEGRFVSGAGDKELTHLICRGDARLIAAAPEMLEALILVRDALDQFALPYKYTRMAEKVFGPQVRDAIKKATGG